MPGSDDHTDGSQAPATQDGPKPNHINGDAVGKPDGSIQGLQNAVDDLESIARLLKAAQRRSRFRVVY